MKQLGLSLSELLISLFLVSLLSSLLIQVYLLNKKHYFALHQALAEHFELHWAQDLLVESIRQAGFTPCLNIEHLQVIDRRISNKKFSGQSIEVKAQEIQSNHMAEHFGVLRSVLNKQELIVSSGASLRVGQALLIADCQRAELHQIIHKKKLADGVLLTSAKPLLFSYSSLTYVGQWLEERWFIKKNPAGIAALYYHQAHSEELTPLIHSMGIKQDGEKQVDIVWDLGKKKYAFSLVVRA